jgi:hypothetical protein
LKEEIKEIKKIIDSIDIKFKEKNNDINKYVSYFSESISPFLDN